MEVMTNNHDLHNTHANTVNTSYNVIVYTTRALGITPKIIASILVAATSATATVTAKVTTAAIATTPIQTTAAKN